MTACTVWSSSTQTPRPPGAVTCRGRRRSRHRPGPFTLNQAFALRIFVDRSIFEVYCGDAALTDRLYPDATATGVDLFAEGGVAHVNAVPAWSLCPSW